MTNPSQLKKKTPPSTTAQLECDRLGAVDCDSADVNGAAVLLMKYVLTLEVRFWLGWGWGRESVAAWVLVGACQTE